MNGVEDAISEMIADSLVDFADKFKDEIKSDIQDEIKSDIQDEIKDEIQDEIESDIRDAIRDEIKDEIMRELSDLVQKEVRRFLESKEEDVPPLKVSPEVEVSVFDLKIMFNPETKVGRIVQGFVRGGEENTHLDMLESLILAHVCSGVDVTNPTYLSGIQTSLDTLDIPMVYKIKINPHNS